ncbi:MAG: hypothetical protein V1853_02180 [bacterium]
MNRPLGFAWLPLLIIIATLAVAGAVGYVVVTENTNSNLNTGNIIRNTNTATLPTVSMLSLGEPAYTTNIYDTDSLVGEIWQVDAATNTEILYAVYSSDGNTAQVQGKARQLAAEDVTSESTVVVGDLTGWQATRSVDFIQVHTYVVVGDYLVDIVLRNPTLEQHYTEYNAALAEATFTGTGSANQLLGGDADEHGCIGSAGYSWCEAKQKCLRTWEEDCSSANTNTNTALNTNTTTTTNTNANVGIDPHWQSYSNTTYGYTMKYPTGWSYSDNTPDGVKVIAFRQGDNTDFSFRVEVDATSNTLQQEADAFVGSSTDYETSNTTVDNQPAIKLVLRETYETVLVINDGKLYMISTGENPTQIEEQMLASLKFTDETTDWQTYTNETYGYSIKYPYNWTASEWIDIEHVQVIPSEYTPGTNQATGRALSIEIADSINENDIIIDGPEAVNINNISAIQQTEGGMVNYLMTYFERDSEGYIRIYWGDAHTDTYPEYNQILSTFQFTE